ncbi:hypothetical protein CVT26_007202 [Gymnopilus dilepis]|uniref:FYVE-type domain-containing protein n=1 Tax=Gymnopilus dilepis TaxID=231916 RepID=A0A409W066_9AGAR|nr:hypothetical protein CVT26_007202 [Gymnopilus dilepis]
MLRLSGDLPLTKNLKMEKACRSCCKEFGIFSPGKRCHHCGYHYCRACATHGWAAWPDSPLSRSYWTVKDSYTVKNVCCFCVELLKITSAGAARLSTSEFSREDLLRYASSYGIIGVVEGQTLSKAELVKVIAELSMDGCNTLPLHNERYYRQHSVPNNLPKSSAGCPDGTLEYRAPRPLVMTWGSRHPWMPTSSDQRSQQLAPQVSTEQSSIVLAAESVHPNLSASAAVSTTSSTSPLCVICQDAEAEMAIISCG